MLNDSVDSRRTYFAQRLLDLVIEASKEGIVLKTESTSHTLDPREQPTNTAGASQRNTRLTVPLETRHPFVGTTETVMATTVAVYHNDAEKDAATGHHFNPYPFTPMFKSMDEVTAVDGGETPQGDRIEVISWKVTGDDNPTKVFAIGHKNPAGAYNSYCIEGLYVQRSGSIADIGIDRIDFQMGNPLENGYNGWTIEQLLSVGFNRLMGYQEGPFACSDNATAATYIQKAIEALQRRTVDRVARQVKNTDQK